MPSVDGVTQARRLSDVEEMARELVAVTTNVPLDGVVIDVHVKRVGDVDVEADLAAIHADREQAAELERVASERSRRLVRALVAQDVSLRDIGAVLGVSHQRAHQLAGGGRPPA
ncbi:hypothetical protein [Cellulomonas rhizosphaerae]|uniref:hypothetical protein n=1 Tax=Cellulomonas rhizosphaerae TaxID=2293719 RepID=UPI0018F3B8C2|nr:hypothetical protein [Cellulomonas rhizosphaerae]